MAAARRNQRYTCQQVADMLANDSDNEESADENSSESCSNGNNSPETSEDSETSDISDNSRTGFEKRQKRRQIRALQEAIDNHDTDLVKNFLDEEFDVDFQYRSQTALQLAVKEGCFDICQLLLERRANVNISDAEMNNLLNMACWRGYMEVAELLVNNNANIDHQNIHGFTSIHTCVLQKQPNILQMLISNGGDVDSATLNGKTPLHLAVLQEETEMVQLLVFEGCKVDKEDESRRTPLMLAAELGQSGIIELLVHGGADVNKRDKFGSTALCDAARNGHLDASEVLVSFSADLNLPTTKGATPLLESITSGHMDISMYLIDKGCDVNQMDRRKTAPIHLAVVSKVSQFFHEEIEQAMLLIKKLVDAGCDLNISNMDGERALYQSACGGNLEISSYLLSKDVDLSVKTKNGDTLLHGGIYGNEAAVVELLMKAGCSLNETNDVGEHPLMSAIVHHSDIKIIEMLVNTGSSLDIRDKNGSNTPLHNAIMHYYSEAALTIIDNGADVNALNRRKHCPLYLACERDDDKIVKKILESPKFSKKFFGVYTIPQPLYAAISNNHVKLVSLLVQMECNINMVNMEGLTPVQLALKENCPLIVNLLLSLNCDLDAQAKCSRLYKCCLQHEDQHPHFDLEPLFIALTHRNIDLLRTLSLCYWETPYKTIRVLDNVLTSSTELNSHFAPELKSEIHDVLINLTKIPRSLQEICRAKIRQRLESGEEFKSRVECLPLASKMKQYVLMEELFGDLQEKIEKQEREHPTTLSNFRSQGTFE